MPRRRPQAGDGQPLRDFLLAARDDTPALAIRRIVHAARRYLALDTAMVVESGATGSPAGWVIRYEDSAYEEPALAVIRPAVAALSHLVVGGRLPEFVSNLHDHWDALPELERDLDLTWPAPIGTMLCVPVRLPDGHQFGAFVCLSNRVETHMGEPDLAIMQLLADLIGDLIHRAEQRTSEASADADRLRQVIDRSELRVAFQPIVRLSDQHPVGHEALARFPASMPGTTDDWFARAWDVGIGLELELHALRMATSRMGQFGDGYLSVNASAATVMSPEFVVLVEQLPAARLVVEVTEQTTAANIDDLARAIDSFSDLGVRLAIDDLGTGFAGLSRMLTLAPDIIKLDIRLTSNIEVNTAQQALVASLSTFALRVGAELVGEGIESEAQLVALRVLGVPYGQGFLLGRPVVPRGR